VPSPHLLSPHPFSRGEHRLEELLGTSLPFFVPSDFLSSRSSSVKYPFAPGEHLFRFFTEAFFGPALGVLAHDPVRNFVFGLGAVFPSTLPFLPPPNTTPSSLFHLIISDSAGSCGTHGNGGASLVVDAFGTHPQTRVLEPEKRASVHVDRRQYEAFLRSVPFHESPPRCVSSTSVL